MSVRITVRQLGAVIRLLDERIYTLSDSGEFAEAAQLSRLRIRLTNALRIHNKKIRK